MKGGGGGGTGGGLATPAPGTFTATASTTSSTAIGLMKAGFLTELSIRVDGDPMASTISGGPVKIEAWLARGSFWRKLCAGGIQNDITVRGSGQLPVSQGDRIVINWTEFSGTAVIVRVDAFVDPQAIGDSAPGWHDESCKARLFHQFRQICTQDNAGGGSLQVTVTPAAGCAIGIQYVRIAASGNRAVQAQINDVDASTGPLIANSTASAGNYTNLPALGGAATSSANTMAGLPMVIPNPSYFTALVASAAQTETATFLICYECIGLQAATVSWALSGGTPNVATATDSTFTLVRA